MDPLVAIVLQTALALLFATAAFHKLRDPRAFAASVRAYRVLPAALSTPAAFCLLTCEIGVGVSLLLPVSARGAALAGLALLLLYSVAIAVNLARGRRDVDCGCLGPDRRQPLSEWLLLRNGVLCAAALAAALPPGTRALVPLDAMTGIAASCALILLFHAAERLAALGPASVATRRSS